MNQNRRLPWAVILLVMFLARVAWIPAAAAADTPAEMEAIQKIEEAGGKVTRGRYKGEPAIRVDLHGTQACDDHLSLLEPLKNMTVLDLAGARSPTRV